MICPECAENSLPFTRDMRTRFCSESCEKKYWRHPPFESITSRMNFHSFQEYMSWEQRTNE